MNTRLNRNTEDKAEYPWKSWGRSVSLVLWV